MQAGWIFPAWQLLKSTDPKQLPGVIPFEKLPSEFKLREDLLSNWVIPHVKNKIFSLAASVDAAPTVFPNGKTSENSKCLYNH